MTDPKILSSEEVNEILNITQENKLDLTQIIGDASAFSALNTKRFSPKKLSNITDLTWAECKRIFTGFTHRKFIFNIKKAEVTTFESALSNKLESRIYFIAKLLPHNFYALVVIDLHFLHQIINIIFGGQINENDVVNETPSKISLSVAEKICHMVLEGFVAASKEYGAISYEMVKMVTLPNLITKIQDSDVMYCTDMEVNIGSFETEINFLVAERFFVEFIPEEIAKPIEKNTKDSWKSNIQTQVADSFVTLSATLPDIKVKLKDFIEMKKDSLITIPDPTSVYLGLNNLKIYRASAGQLNEKRVVEIEREI